MYLQYIYLCNHEFTRYTCCASIDGCHMYVSIAVTIDLVASYIIHDHNTAREFSRGYIELFTDSRGCE